MIKQLHFNSLLPADVVVAKKRNGIGRILNHYIVYVGNNTFIGNLKEGVKIISNSELNELFTDYEPIRIRRFQDTSNERKQALNRAYSNLGKTYDLIYFNCEHFANLVQKGIKSSSQVFLATLICIGLTYKLTNSFYGERN